MHALQPVWWSCRRHRRAAPTGSLETVTTAVSPWPAFCTAQDGPRKVAASLRLAKAFGDEEQGDRLACVESTYQSAQQVSGTAKLGDIIGEEDLKLICKFGPDGDGTVLPGVDMLCAPTSKLMRIALKNSKHYKDKLLYSLAQGQWHQRRNGVYVPISEVEVQSAVLAYGEELKGS